MINKIEKSKDTNNFKNNEKFLIFVIISQRFQKRFFTEFWNQIYKNSEASLEAKIKFISGLFGGLGILANFKLINKEIKIDVVVINIILKQIFQNFSILVESIDLTDILNLIRFLIILIKIEKDEIAFRAKPILENILREEKLYGNAGFIRLMINDGFFKEKIFIFLDFFDHLYFLLKSNVNELYFKVFIQEIIYYFDSFNEKDFILNSQFTKKKIIFFLKILYFLRSEKYLDVQSISLFSDEKNIDFDYSQQVIFTFLHSINIFISSQPAIIFLS